MRREGENRAEKVKIQIQEGMVPLKTDRKGWLYV